MRHGYILSNHSSLQRLLDIKSIKNKYVMEIFKIRRKGQAVFKQKSRFSDMCTETIFAFGVYYCIV